MANKVLFLIALTLSSLQVLASSSSDNASDKEKEKIIKDQLTQIRHNLIVKIADAVINAVDNTRKNITDANPDITRDELNVALKHAAVRVMKEDARKDIQSLAVVDHSNQKTIEEVEHLVKDGVANIEKTLPKTEIATRAIGGSVQAAAANFLKKILLGK